MKIECLGSVQYINDKVTKDDQTGKEEQYTKVTIKDMDSGQFVSFTAGDNDYYTEEEILAVKGKATFSTWKSKMYISVKDPIIKRFTLVDEEGQAV